jgi:PAS domain S-box-containing protein
MERRIIAGAGGEFYRTLLERMTDGVSLATGDGIIVYSNPAEDRMFGYERGELIGHHVSVQNAYPAAENAVIVESVIGEIRRNGAWRGEWRNRRKDGSEFTTFASITQVEFEGAPHFLCVQRDVTEQQRIADELRDSRTRLELATHAAAIGIWDWDVASSAMVYSERAKAIYGFPAGKPVTYEQVRDATHPDDLPRTSMMARRALDPELREKEPYEYRIVRTDGTIRWVLAHGEAVFPPTGGQAVRYVGTIQDITERKNLHQALEASEARLKLAIGAGGLAVWEYRSTTNSIVTSPELNALLGFSPDEQVSTEDLRSRYAPGARQKLQEHVGAALNRGERQVESEVEFVLPSGETRWMLLRAEFLSTEGTPLPDVLGVLVDITQHKRAEERLRLLIDELNHRVKNTLAVVQSIAAQTLRGSENEADARRRLEGRLQALAGAHDILTNRFWEGADIEQVVHASVVPQVGDRADRLACSGPPVVLEPKTALSFALAFHELATNALKYGSLSNISGRVDIDWDLAAEADRRQLSVRWRESGGPPVAPPAQRGFGSRLIERSLSAEQGGGVEVEYAAEGLTCKMTVDLPTPSASFAAASPRR